VLVGNGTASFNFMKMRRFHLFTNLTLVLSVKFMLFSDFSMCCGGYGTSGINSNLTQKHFIVTPPMQSP